MEISEQFKDFKFLAIGGEMGERIRSFDWVSNPLGSPNVWPSALISTLSICLTARFPMAIYWGEQGFLLYNDAWRPILGNKHPWALGKAAHEVWPEIWETINPLFESVRSTGQATWRADELLPMKRYGFTEECYFDYTFNPIMGVSGEFEGILNIVQETTFRFLNERRTKVLRELASSSASAKTKRDACKIITSALATDPWDIPFALLYLVEPDKRHARLAGSTGVIPGSLRLSDSYDLQPVNGQKWPFSKVFQERKPVVLEDFQQRFGAVSAGSWPEPISQAILLPVAGSGQESIVAILAVGVNPRRRLDDEYHRFFELASSHVSSTLASAAAYEEERARAEALEQLDKAKTTFFGNVSHELRTPLTLILGPLEDEIRESNAPRERIELAHRNSLRLLKLVNTLLDFSRIEAGRMEASFEPTDIASLTAELASVFRSGIERAGLKLLVNCESLPEPVYLDRDMWEKIVFNLLSNALKFTAEGEIEVEIALRPPNRARLIVRDTGIGIAASELPAIFERFRRVRSRWARSHEGTGIGLALVQELVRLHGGEVTVESTEGRGTTFTVSIPVGQDHLPRARIGAPRKLLSTSSGVLPYVEETLRWVPQSAEVPPHSAGSETNPQMGDGPSGINEKVGTPPERILLADDNADMRGYIQRILTGRGYDVVAVADGQDALEAARAHVPSLVLSDVMMPRLDGFGLVHELRKDPATKSIPIILLSARAGEEARVEGVEAGADDYLTKPFSARELLARITTHLELARVRRESHDLLKTANEKLQTVLNSISDGLAVLDKNWRYTFFSEQAARIIGLKSDEILGRCVWDLFPNAKGTKFYEGYHRAAATGKVVQFEEYYPEPLNKWLECHCYPSEVGLSVYFHDITERKVAEDALKEAHEQLADKAKHLESLVQQRTAKLTETIGDLEAFSYSIAHDMRAPLRSLQGFSHILLSEYDGKLDDEGRAYLKRIAASAARMDRLIQDVLNYSRVVRTDLTLEKVDVARLLQGIMETYPGLSPQDAEIELKEPFPIVLGNEAMLMQVFSNLLGNAVKFVSAGVKPKIKLWAETNGPLVRLFVKDNGIGIEPDQQGKIFDIFQQVEKRSDSTGIGLAIVKKASARMGGRVGVQSELGHGSTFWIELNRAEESQP